MARRFGWAEQHPGWWNWPGLIFVALGSIVVLWFWFVHVRKVSAREKVELKSTPDYLLTDGPYRYSRNPAYLAVLIIWFSWAVFTAVWWSWRACLSALGHGSQIDNPNGVVANVSNTPNENGMAATVLRLEMFVRTLTQGSSFLATLG